MIYEFAGFLLNTDRMALSSNGSEIPVEPQVFDILRVLAENAGSLVTKDQLIDQVWDGRIVSEATISARINAARVAVNDNGTDQSVIRTVPRRGFELVAAVSSVSKPEAPNAITARQTIRYTTAKDGANIAWSSAGEGPPLILAWHQFSHLETDWSSPLMVPILQRLLPKFRLIRYDIRGSGLSDPIDETVTVDTHAEDLITVARAAEVEGCAAIAVLQSAAFAIRALELSPGLFNDMVLWTAYARGRMLRPGAPEEAKHDPFLSLLDSGGWGDVDSPFMRAWSTMVMPGAAFDQTTELIRQIRHSGTTRDAVIQRKLIDNMDVRASLGAVTCPTLVIHPRLSAVHPAPEGRRVAAGIEGAEFLELDSANTYPIPGDPTFDQQLDETIAFLSKRKA